MNGPLRRYVLTKDNRIIDTNNKTFKHHYTLENGFSKYSIEIPNETFTHYGLGGGEWENNTYEFRGVDIKVQSENVFDLIEVGDLVKEYGNIYEISDINSDNRRTFVSQPADFKHQEWEISAIYKPNSRGDYIKVWEVKDNESK